MHSQLDIIKFVKIFGLGLYLNGLFSIYVKRPQLTFDMYLMKLRMTLIHTYMLPIITL